MYFEWAAASCQATGGGSPLRMGSQPRARAVSFLSGILSWAFPYNVKSQMPLWFKSNLSNHRGAENTE
ncbi:hypothetical protein [Nostoc sp.]|uniref:hypothetical protein n=1 Tax=Nostoc sp. TaxID=1180 RepID=UPI002FFCE2BD